MFNNIQTDQVFLNSPEKDNLYEVYPNLSKYALRRNNKTNKPIDQQQSLPNQ